MRFLPFHIDGQLQELELLGLELLELLGREPM
jgi:hypothetical protein